MEIRILHSAMTQSKEDGYVGTVHFEVEGHREPYEMTIHRKGSKDWSYGLHFLSECGPEEEILAVEDRIEEDDELFDRLVQSALDKLERKAKPAETL